MHSKDKQLNEEKAEVVYSIPCKNCDSVYVGETGPKEALTFSVCKCPWFLEKTKVNQLFFYAQFYLFWVKYFMTVKIVCLF